MDGPGNSRGGFSRKKVARIFQGYPDLGLIVLWVIASVAAMYIPYLNESPVRIFLVLPLILFIPGYALIAALFPGASEINSVERVALSLGISIAVVPLIGFGLSYTARGIDLDPVVFSVATLTLFFSLVAFMRRQALPIEKRYSPPFSAVFSPVKRELFSQPSGSTARILSFLLLAVVLIAIGSTIYVAAIPAQEEKYTDFFILGSNGSAGDYPSLLVPGRNYSVFIGIGNHESGQVSYTVEVWALAIQRDEATNTTSVSGMNLVGALPVTVSRNETVILPYNLSVTDQKYNQIGFLLFNESLPRASLSGNERIAASYRNLHLWIGGRT